MDIFLYPAEEIQIDIRLGDSLEPLSEGSKNLPLMGVGD